jgi:hypothetical protein
MNTDNLFDFIETTAFTQKIDKPGFDLLARKEK